MNQVNILKHSQNARIEKVAVVSHNYTILNRYGFQDFSEHFLQINKACDLHGCDTVLYSLFTWDEKSPLQRSYKSIFGGFSKVRRVILEIGNKTSIERVIEVWSQEENHPRVLRQCFVKSSASDKEKRAFIEELPSRTMDNSIIMICGESNIANFAPASRAFKDPFQFNEKLKSMGIKLVLNPLHDYMTRYEMKKKRGYYSRDGRIVITVWNQGKRKGESSLPWTLFHNEKDMTQKVCEISNVIQNRPDIRIGVIAISDLGRCAYL